MSYSLYKKVSSFFPHSVFGLGDSWTSGILTDFLNYLIMKTSTVLYLFAVVAFAAARPDTSDKYTDRYDSINLEEIVHNKRLLVPYIKCALEQGRCSPEGKELKKHIKEALETYCEKCTNTQRDGTRRVIGHLINYEPQYWNELTNKYDPARKYVVRYEKDLTKVKAQG